LIHFYKRLYLVAEMGWQESLENKNKTVPLFRGTSCVGEPATNAAQCIRTKDLRLFVDILNSDEEERLGDAYPLPEDHWINQPLQSEEGNTLLTAAINSHLHHFVEVLLKAGARADLYNPEINKYPLHVAVSVGELECVKLLFSTGSNNNIPNINATN